MRAACLLVLLFLGSPNPAIAELLLVRYDRLSDTVSVRSREADARRVVQELFNQCGGAPYMLAPDFGGRITVHLKQVTPMCALRTILDRAGGDYRMLGRTYYIYPRPPYCGKCRGSAGKRCGLCGRGKT